MKASTGNSEKQKRPYFPPKLKEITQEQAEQLVKDRTNCSDSEAEDIVESLLRERDQPHWRAS
jgi:hypothetical protein